MRVSGEIMALLNARPQKYQVIAVAFERMSGEDVAHAQAHVEEEGPRLLGRAKFAGQLEYLTPIMELYWPKVKRIAKRRHWRVNHDKLRTMAFFTLHEYVKPPRCTLCKGRGSTRLRLVKGEKIKASDPLTCQRCKGSTFEPLRDADYARALEISEASWSTNNWRHKQKEIRAILDGWEIDWLDQMLDFLAPRDTA